MGFFRNKEKVENKNGGSANGWEGMDKVPFAGDAKKPRKLTPEQRQKQYDADRQKHKIAAGMLYGADYALNNYEVNLRDGDYEQVLDQIVTGEMGEDEERGFLEKIQDPRMKKGVNAMFMQDFQTKHAARILAKMSGGDFYHFERNTPNNVANFLQKYPLPMDFEMESWKFLRDIKRDNGEQKFEEYKVAMEAFKASMYGKRQEYWDQMKAMHVEAVNRPAFEVADKHEQREWIRHAQIEGDPWVMNGRQYQLTPKILSEYGIVPEFKAKVDGVDMRFSGTFKVGTRDAMIGYIKGDDGKIHVRGYYRSNSQGMWRYLPDYVNGGSGEIEYYGKGGFNSAEESATLPFELQRKMSAIAAAPEGRHDDLARTMRTDFLLAGTAAHYWTKDQLINSYNTGTSRGAFYREVARRPSFQMGELRYGAKVPPGALTVTGGAAPNFRKTRANFHMQMGDMYGDVQVRTFDSMDKRLSYMVCENPQGEAWIATVQKRSHITSTGCRAEWVAAGDVGTPLYDYASLSDGYGGRSVTGSYVSMWENYLSKAPIIQQYKRRDSVLTDFYDFDKTVQLDDTVDFGKTEQLVL